ncbi:MAG: diguanylate cyclase [Synergistaceae bacterium]|nr:diguanylate cyclase [Synergistaceae bacterium]
MPMPPETARQQQRIKILEERNALLWKEKNVGMETLEAATLLSTFDTSLNKLDDPRLLLEQILGRVQQLIAFEACAIYLVDEDSSFYPALCSPVEFLPQIEQKVAQRIEDRTFSWAIKRKKPVVSYFSSSRTTMILHVMTTISRTRGMFVRILNENWEGIADYALASLSLTLPASATALERYELYSNLRKLNLDLSLQMEEIEKSRKELALSRNFLEDQVQIRTRELLKANEEMKIEMTERMRAEEDLMSSEKMLKLALLGVGDGLWIWDVPSGKMDLSSLSLEILGCDAEMPPTEGSILLSGEHSSPHLPQWEELILEEDRLRLKEAIKKCLTGETENYRLEYRVHGKDGTIRWILDRGCVVARDEEGKPTRIAGTHSDITERKTIEVHIHHQATHDFLTGLPNRYLFSDRLAHALLLSRRRNTGVALFFVDIDDFKAINDRWGHDLGDQLLRGVADRISSSIREMDTVCRYGGDEFTIVFPDMIDREEVEGVVRRLMETFREPFIIENHSLHIHISVGIALSGLSTSGSDELLKQADIAMFKAKEKGKNTYVFAEDFEPTGSKKATSPKKVR